MSENNSLLIVGGGTAGWLSAAIFAAHHKNRSKADLTITLVESSDIPTVGVGEGTWPTLRNTIRDIGLDEKTVFRECHAGFKQGGKFVNWVTADDYYYHPFTVPMGYGQVDMAPYVDDVVDFAREANFQEAVCEAGLAPRELSEGDFQGICNYAYHLDAGAFANLLKNFCKEELGVAHVIATVSDVVLDDDGMISHLIVDKNGEMVELKSDVFVDCTGFRSLILGEALGEKLQSMDHILFNDRALALHVPYENDDDPLACHTIATGQNAGWTWDIGLTSRRGVGHVFSSAYLSEEEAAENLVNYLGGPIDNLNVKSIKFSSGYRKNPWVKNCIAIGLSGGFVEPLEATAIMLIEVAARYLAENFPVNNASMAVISKRFNQQMGYRWQRIMDFLKLHYMLTQRTEPYWEAHTDPETIPESLLEDLEVWKYRGPVKTDFDGIAELFPAASYQYVLYGMGHRPNYSEQAYLYNQSAQAERLVERNRLLTQQLLTTLPPHRDYIEHWLSR